MIINEHNLIPRLLQKIPGLTIHQFLSVNKILFIVNPKVGSSSVIFSMLKSYLDKENVSRLDFYKHVSFSGSKKLKSKSEESNFNFAITRDPFSRLYSCYKQKILIDDTPRYTKNYFFQYYPLIKSEQNFRDFVKAVCKIPDYLSEKHFMSQSRILNYSKNTFNINKFYKISNLSLLEEDLKHELSANFKLEKRNISNKKNIDLLEVYDEELISLVYKRYQADIDNFNYVNIYEQLMDNL
jgi:hypothetical protein